MGCFLSNVSENTDVVNLSSDVQKNLPPFKPSVRKLQTINDLNSRHINVILSQWSRNSNVLIPNDIIQLIESYSPNIAQIIGNTNIQSTYGTLSQNTSPWAILFKGNRGDIVCNFKWYLLQDIQSNKMNEISSNTSTLSVFIQEWTGNSTLNYYGQCCTSVILWEETVEKRVMTRIEEYTFDCRCILPSNGIYALCISLVKGSHLKMAHVGKKNKSTVGLRNVKDHKMKKLGNGVPAYEIVVRKIDKMMV